MLTLHGKTVLAVWAQPDVAMPLGQEAEGHYLMAHGAGGSASAMEKG